MTAGTGVPRRRVLPTDLLRADSGAKARPAPPSLLAAAATVLETRLFPRRRESGCQAQPGVQTPTREQGDWVALTNPTTTPPPATPPRSPGHMGGVSRQEAESCSGESSEPEEEDPTVRTRGFACVGPLGSGATAGSPPTRRRRVARGECPPSEHKQTSRGLQTSEESLCYERKMKNESERAPEESELRKKNIF